MSNATVNVAGTTYSVPEDHAGQNAMLQLAEQIIVDCGIDAESSACIIEGAKGVQIEAYGESHQFADPAALADYLAELID